MSMQDAGCNKEEDKPITVPLWQMMQEEKEPAPEDEDKSDRFNCLTSRVRACYLRNLEKVLLNNYELCSKEERSEFPFSKEQVMKAAEQLEGRALRSCMVVILYQRAMMRLINQTWTIVWQSSSAIIPVYRVKEILTEL